MRIFWTKCVKNLDFNGTFCSFSIGDEIRWVAKTMNLIFFKIKDQRTIPLNNKKAFHCYAYRPLAPTLYASIAIAALEEGRVSWSEQVGTSSSDGHLMSLLGESLYCEILCPQGLGGGEVQCIMVKQNDRHLLKHYLLATSFAGGHNNNNNKVKMFIGILFPSWSHECEIWSTDFWPL